MLDGVVYISMNRISTQQPHILNSIQTVDKDDIYMASTLNYSKHWMTPSTKNPLISNFVTFVVI